MVSDSEAKDEIALAVIDAFNIWKELDHGFAKCGLQTRPQPRCSLIRKVGGSRHRLNARIAYLCVRTVHHYCIDDSALEIATLIHKREINHDGTALHLAAKNATNPL